MIIHSPEELALLVRYTRRRHKLSQEQVAETVGLKQTTISAFTSILILIFEQASTRLFLSLERETVFSCSASCDALSLVMVCRRAYTSWFSDYAFRTIYILLLSLQVPFSVTIPGEERRYGVSCCLPVSDSLFLTLLVGRLPFLPSNIDTSFDIPVSVHSCAGKPFFLCRLTRIVSSYSQWYFPYGQVVFPISPRFNKVTSGCGSGCPQMVPQDYSVIGLTMRPAEAISAQYSSMKSARTHNRSTKTSEVFVL